MNCQKVQSLLSAYHDGELSTEQRPAVAEHIGGCSNCSAELAVFECISSMSKGLADPQPPEGIWTGIEATLDAGSVKTPIVRLPGHQSRDAKKWRPGFLVTAALVLMAAGESEI
jgi:anti-sigma factor RsiW